MYEQDLYLKEEKEKRSHLKREMDFLIKLFNPKEIMAALGLASSE